MPRYVILVLANAFTEDDSKAEGFLAMKKFNTSLKEAGLLQTAEGLAPISEGYRVSFGSSQEVEKGPFDKGGKGTINGYWFVKADNVEIVLEFAKKIPFAEGQVEVRRIREAEEIEKEFLG